MNALAGSSFGSKSGQLRRASDYSVAFSGFTQLVHALQRIEDGAYPELRDKIKKIGDEVGLLAASYAPRLTGELQHSVKTSMQSGGMASASIYSTSVYGGAQNFGAWTQHGRGPHIRRANASHYMDRAVSTSQAYVEAQLNEVLDWLSETFEEDG